jgi:subtilisin family serine protease
VPLQADDKTKYGEALTKYGGIKVAGKTAFVGQQSLEFQSAWEEMLMRESAADLTIQAIDRNILSVGRGQGFAISDEPSFPVQRDLFDLIGHPFGKDEEMALPYRSPVEVLVVDDEMDPLHCDLPQLDGGAPTDMPAGECGQITSPAHPIFDHAVHVVGLISAPMNKKGMLGLNPNARVSHEKVDLRFSSSADIESLMNTLVQRSLQQKARVINMSWAFEPEIGQGRELEAGIIAFDKTALIVAAAGNDGKDLTNDCRILPACFGDLDNVITVVGLNRELENPDLWVEGQLGSNASRDFHIAAIAERVLSTVRDNKLGHLSGTSQAAPQVTATASLIISAVEFIHQDEIAETNGKVPPKIVKQRLMYSADLFLGLKAKVRSGRLNVHRAINIVDTQVKLRQADGSPKKLAGTLIQIPIDILICRKPSGDDVDHSWGSIRRLAFEPFSKRYTIFKNASKDDRSSDLIRIDGCNMVTRSHIGKLLLDDGSEVEFEMGNILDYTSPMLQ